MLDIDAAIKHCLDVAEQNEISAITYKNCKEIKTNMYEKLTAEKAENDCRECATEHRQLAKWLTELKEAKRLLKAAVEGFNLLGNYLDDNCPINVNCIICPLHRDINCKCWKHKDEALALIGEDTNVPASAVDTNVGRKSDGWISCEDRLPKENILVLCYARSTTGEGNSCFLGAIVHGEFWFLQVNVIGHVSFPVLHWEVTHWQPLPEPPKDGEQND